MKICFTMGSLRLEELHRALCALAVLPGRMVHAHCPEGKPSYTGELFINMT